jgi:hypothetical protein
MTHLYQLFFDKDCCVIDLTKINGYAIAVDTAVAFKKILQ